MSRGLSEADAAAAVEHSDGGGVVEQRRTESGQPPVADVPVPAGHVISAIQADGVLGMRDIVAMLTGVGYRVPDLSTVSQDGKVLLSFELDGQSAWLPSYQPVGLWHLGRIAVRLGRDPAKAAARLRELGYEVPEI